MGEPGRAGQGRDLLTSIKDSVDNYVHQVEIQPNSTVTITSSKAEIPISFRNNGITPVTVHLKLDSDRLLFPNGAEQNIVLSPKHNTTVRVPVEHAVAPVR